MNLGQIETLFWYSNVVAAGLLLLVMWRQKLISVYPALFAYVVVDFLQQLTGIVVVNTIGFRGPTYFIVYASGQILKIGCASKIVVELTKYVLVSFPALAKYAQTQSRRAVLGALTLSGLMLWLTPPPRTARGGWTLPYFYSFERTMDLSILLLLLSLAIFTAWFPTKLSKNSAYYLGGYFTFFLVRWIGTNGQTFALQYRLELSTAMLGCAMLCLGGLAFWLSKQGEEEMVKPGHSWNPEAMMRLEEQMTALNANLARVRPQA
jgi:hypothetical protein